MKNQRGVFGDGWTAIVTVLAIVLIPIASTFFLVELIAQQGLSTSSVEWQAYFYVFLYVEMGVAAISVGYRRVGNEK